MEGKTRKYYLSSVIYAALALLGGVFYREFTKGFSYVDKTTLSVVHVHYLVLGTVFFLLLLLLQKSFAFEDKKTNVALILYHVGLNVTCAMFLVRGILQVTGTHLSDGLNVFKKKKQEKE